MSAGIKTGAVLFARNMKKVAAFYQHVAGMRRMQDGDDHIVLKAGSYELIVHAIPKHLISDDTDDAPQQVPEDSRVKFVFFVDSLAKARKATTRYGGLMQGKDREWRYLGATVCDGCDPEGNVVQFRARVAKAASRKTAKKRGTAKKRR